MTDALSGGRGFLRRILPWIISIAALYYVFSATDWERLLDATRHADLPMFVFYVTVDKLVFFSVWALVQAAAIRRFVFDVPIKSLFALRGASEAFRAVNNPLADGAFLLGVARLTGRYDGVLAAALIPFVMHFLVLLIQATVALPFARGTATDQGVALLVGVGWLLIGALALLIRISRSVEISFVSGVQRWLDRVSPRSLLPYFGWFAVLGFFDIVIQGLASRAFGIPIDWAVLAVRLPLLYAALSLPSVGNFGIREFTWAGLFEDYATRDALFAYAFATNALFVVVHVLIGAVFLNKALELLGQVRARRKRGEATPRLRDALRREPQEQ